MKIFLSAIDPYTTDEIIARGIRMKWNLLSYFQMRKGNMALFNKVQQHSEQMLVDSGAHSFQKGKKVDWMQYTKEYAEWIKANDNPKIIGFFEMDVDNIIGYDKVLSLRKILDSVTPKIIPVWHKNRGIAAFKDMCREYSGRIVAVTGFRNEDIKDSQYPLFLKEAKKYGCKMHCLGMTRREVLDKVPFDFTDSASWKLKSSYGKVENVKDKRIKKGLNTKKDWSRIWAYQYIEGMKMQEHYYNKWKWYCKD